MITAGDVKWIAGFLEGEGCFPKAHQLSVSAVQVQLWPLQELQRLVGGTIRAKKVSNPRAQPSHQWTLHGPRAAELCMSLYALMSPKRKEAIRRALAQWRTKPFRSGDRKHCPRGHSYDKIRQGNRHCSVCDRASGRARWWKRKPVRDIWYAKRIEASEHRPCLCGCGGLVPLYGTRGRPRQGWLHNHDKRRADPLSTLTGGAS